MGKFRNEQILFMQSANVHRLARVSIDWASSGPWCSFCGVEGIRYLRKIWCILIQLNTRGGCVSHLMSFVHQNWTDVGYYKEWWFAYKWGDCSCSSQSFVRSVPTLKRVKQRACSNVTYIVGKMSLVIITSLLKKWSCNKGNGPGEES
jgi:hypothetical protein